MSRMIVGAVAFAMALVACQKTPPSPPPTDAGDGGADLCAQACGNLDHLGCPEAKGCEVVCRHAQQTKKFDMNPQCLLDAKTPDAARECKTVTCKR